MSVRLTFAARIGLIVVIGLGMAWTTAIGAYYIARGHGIGLAPLSDPARVAAVVELMEKVPESVRPMVERATSSDGFVIDVQPGNEVGTNAPIFLPRLNERATQTYLDALGGRPVNVAFEQLHARPRLFHRFWPDLVRIRVGLRTGGVLTVAIGNPLLLGPFGMPVGFGAGIMGSLIALISLLVMHRETKPLARLAEAVDRVDLSPDPVLLPQSRRSAPEIRALIDAFNRLQSRLGELLRSRMVLLGGISHDVRTFATRLRLRAEKIGDPVERERAYADIGDMIQLLDDALLASRAGASEMAEELVEIDDVIHAEISDRHAQGARIDYRPASATEPPVILGDRLALRRIVANLVENALKYGHAAHLGGSIDGAIFLLTVDDEGPGIPEVQRASMLEPFSRLETSRSRGTGGAGLGLAIASSLAEAHGGSLVIDQAPVGGARLLLRLPLFRAT